MYEDKILEDLNEAFRSGQDFDQIVVALAKAAAQKPLNLEDQEAINVALDFIKGAKKGYSWLDKPSVSEEAKSFASSFQMAVQCTKEKSEPTRWIAELDLFIETLESLRIGRRPHQNALKQVIDFFDNVFRASIEGIDHALQRRATWMPS